MAGVIGATPGILAGVAVGGAATAALDPAFEIPKQDAWSRNPNKILDATLLARLVAQGGVDLTAAAAEALRDGFKQDKLDALIYLEQTVPGSGEAMSLWRRGLMSDALFEHVLIKAGLDQRYVTGIIDNKTAEPLGIGDIAYAVVRGILPAPPWVPVPPPTHGDKVPRFPVVDVDPVKLAELVGFDERALQIMVGRSGLSMAPGMAAQASFRDIIGPDDYLLAIAEGDLRTEWAQPVLEVSREIPTPGEAVEGHLRGWISQQGMYDQTARHGMTPADTDLLFDIKGRPIPVHQITTGLARGGTYPATYADVPEPYRQSLEESDIRPEWASLAYANRYTYPSAFVLRALAEAGELGDAAQVEAILLDIGWPPDLAKRVSGLWVPAGTTADKHVTKAQTQLWTAVHKAYVNGLATDAEATDDLTKAGVDATAIPQVLGFWQAERTVERRSLSPAQIKKAVGQPGFDETTATARLQALGYSLADAQTFLSE